MILSVEKYALTTQTYGVPLICTTKKYTRAQPHTNEDVIGPSIILLLGHGAGFPKETWEPTIEDLFEMDAKRTTGPVIREVWALDCQNHGEACTINEDVLSRKQGLFTIWDYAEAFATLVKSGLFGTVDPKVHQVVLCGHSAGAVGVTLATSHFNPPSQLPFSKMILVDPPIWGKEMEGQQSDMYKMVRTMTPLRKDVWKNIDDASSWLKKGLPSGAWDDRVFKTYAKFGLRALPTACYPDKTGVTLSTPRLEENFAFTGIRFIYDALDRLNQICTYVPVHLIYGNKNDMFDRKVQDSLINEREGRVFSSIVRIEDVGHLIPQQAPTKLAEAILKILVIGSNTEYRTSKL